MDKLENEQSFEKAEILIRRLDGINKFRTKYGVMPIEGARKLTYEMHELADSIEENGRPQNRVELLKTELKRRMGGEATYLEQQLSGRLYDFDSVISILGIPREDINNLRPWLNENKDKTQKSIDRLFYARDIQGSELGLSGDIPSVRRQAEEFVGVHIQRYHKTLGKFLQGQTNVGEFIRDINAVPSTNYRSYFQPLTNTLAISIPNVCYSTEDGVLHIKDRELIRMYGHEGMGHALNFIVSRTGDLPGFLTKTSPLIFSTAESVAQHYENVLLEDLLNHTDIQKQLGIESRFSDIYQEAKDTEQLEDYKRRCFQYAISVLGDTSIGDSQDHKTLAKKTSIIDEVSIDPTWASYVVQSNRYNFDSEGNLNSELISELLYCARPVPRALEEFAKQGIQYSDDGRNIIDSTLLNGLWTPIGFVDNARLIAQEYKNK